MLSNTARDKALLELAAKSEDLLRERIQPELAKTFSRELTEPWRLEVDPYERPKVAVHSLHQKHPMREPLVYRR